MKNQQNYQIEQIETGSLIPYARNAKKHDDAQVAKIAGSIREFGFNNPVLIDSENGIVAGHGRVLAAQKLGLASVPCLRLSHLTDAQRKAYILADNRLAEIGGGWDEEMLKLELADLGEQDVDLEAIGFTDSDAGVFDISESEMPTLADGDKQPFQQKTFTLHDEQAEEVEAAISKAKEMGHAQSAVNENSNGNAIAFICQFFNRNKQ
jgi:ParB-like chromosome segregation protein Spo0J